MRGGGGEAGERGGGAHALRRACESVGTDVCVCWDGRVSLLGRADAMLRCDAEGELRMDVCMHMRATAHMRLHTHAHARIHFALLIKNLPAQNICLCTYAHVHSYARTGT